MDKIARNIVQVARLLSTTWTRSTRRAWNKRSGYCYLRLFPTQYRGVAVRVLGAYPTAQKVAQTSQIWHTDARLLRLKREGPTAHVYGLPGRRHRSYRRIDMSATLLGWGAGVLVGAETGSRGTIRCFKCKEAGHLSIKCPQHELTRAEMLKKIVELIKLISNDDGQRKRRQRSLSPRYPDSSATLRTSAVRVAAISCM